MKTRADHPVKSGVRSWRATGAMGVLVAIFVIRAWLALTDHGIFWPDEIFQTLEPAHRFAFGYGFIPWEFQDGARSWLLPGFFGLLWKTAGAVGVSESPVLLGIARLSMVGLSVLAAAGALRIARQLGGERAALTSGVFVCCFPALLMFNHRAMTETASAPALVWATVFVLLKRFRTAGALGALAIFLRYQNGLFLAGLGCMVLATRSRPAIARFFQGALPVLLLGGALDELTWGHLFHSFITYVRFNLIEGKASGFGVAPFSYYLDVAWSSTGGALLVLAMAFLAGAPAWPGLWANCAVFVLAHSLIPHKEFRFLLPVMPLILALAAVGLDRIFSRIKNRLTKPVAEPRKKSKRTGQVRPEAQRTLRPWAYTVVVAVLGLAMAWRAAHLTFAEMGQYMDQPSGGQSAWHHVEAYNRLLWRAAQQPDLCGLGLVGKGVVWIGGYSYLHRDVPFYHVSPRTLLGSPDQVGANYLLAPASFPAPVPWAPVAEIDDVTLFRKDASCGPPPRDYRLLPR